MEALLLIRLATASAPLLLCDSLRSGLHMSSERNRLHRKMVSNTGRVTRALTDTGTDSAAYLPLPRRQTPGKLHAPAYASAASRSVGYGRTGRHNLSVRETTGKPLGRVIHHESPMSPWLPRGSLLEPISHSAARSSLPRRQPPSPVLHVLGSASPDASCREATCIENLSSYDGKAHGTTYLRCR